MGRVGTVETSYSLSLSVSRTPTLRSQIIHIDVLTSDCGLQKPTFKHKAELISFCSPAIPVSTIVFALKREWELPSLASITQDRILPYLKRSKLENIMEFKRSQLLSTNFVAGYLLSPPKNNSKRVKLGRKRLLQPAAGQTLQVSLVKQQVKTVSPRNYSPQVAQPTRRRVFTVKELFEKYEESYHNALYLEAIKFILEQIYWDSYSYPEEGM